MFKFAHRRDRRAESSSSAFHARRTSSMQSSGDLASSDSSGLVARRRRALRRDDDEREVGPALHNFGRAVNLHAVEIVVAAFAQAVQKQHQRPLVAIGFVVLRNEQQDSESLRRGSASLSPTRTVSDCGQLLARFNVDDRRFGHEQAPREMRDEGRAARCADHGNARSQRGRIARMPIGSEYHG